MTGWKIGEDVEVVDDGLVWLRMMRPDIPPNHHGRVKEVFGDIIYVEFPIDGSYEHSQVSPYHRDYVRKR